MRSGTSFLLNFLIVFALTLFNLLMIRSVGNIALALLEAITVIVLVFLHKTSYAVIWHFIFVLTCVSANTAFEVEGLDDTLMYSYSRLKLVGPVGLSYVISIFLLFVTRRKWRFVKRTLFYKLYKLFWLLFGAGILIGVFGLLFSDYYISAFISYGVYMGMVLVNMALLMNIFSEKSLTTIRELLLPLLVGATIAAVVSFAFGISTSYSGIGNLVLMPDITYYGVIMLLLLPASPNKLLTVVAIVCFVVTMIFQLSGKGVFINGLGLVLFLYQLLSSKRIHSFVKVAVVSVMVGAGFYIVNNVELGLLSTVKIDQAKSLFQSGGDVGEVASSPRVRVATTLNIIDEGIRNPIFLLFGHGYGGYFQDDLGLMKGMDLTDGGWPPEIVEKGKFPTAHDTFSTVPLLNGFIGLLLLVYISLKYVFRSLKNPFAFAVIPWVVLTFYFNIQTAMAGMLFLFATENYAKTVKRRPLKRKKMEEGAKPEEETEITDEAVVAADTQTL